MSRFSGDFAAPLPKWADVVIVGGGPGGLTCAERLAQKGVGVLLLERKSAFGHKVCAGGVTSQGLLPRVPTELLERVFSEQHLISPRQRIVVRDPQPAPIVATLSRRRLGQWMARQAAEAGAQLRGGAQVLAVEPGRVTVRAAGGVQVIGCEHVVGADGARSLLRRTLGLPSRLFLGLNARLPLVLPRMEWHLAPRLFGAGYAWIFPHRDTSSVGALADAGRMGAACLRQNLERWAAGQGLATEGVAWQAGFINAAYCGLCFGRQWLVGDAAGLASPLTGEGIFPAVASGEAVAEMIVSRQSMTPALAALIQGQRRHWRILDWSGRNPLLTGMLAEVLLLLLRLRVLDFHQLEMSTLQQRNMSRPRGPAPALHD